MVGAAAAEPNHCLSLDLLICQKERRSEEIAGLLKKEIDPSDKKTLRFERYIRSYSIDDVSVPALSGLNQLYYQIHYQIQKVQKSSRLSTTHFRGALNSDDCVGAGSPRYSLSGDLMSAPNAKRFRFCKWIIRSVL